LNFKFRRFVEASFIYAKIKIRYYVEIFLWSKRIFYKFRFWKYWKFDQDCCQSKFICYNNC